MRSWIVFLMLMVSVIAVERPCPKDQCLVYTQSRATPVCVPCHLRRAEEDTENHDDHSHHHTNHNEL